jgi:hypothetical protein
VYEAETKQMIADSTPAPKPAPVPAAFPETPVAGPEIVNNPDALAVGLMLVAIALPMLDALQKFGK